MEQWTWRFDGYHPDLEKTREALCTLGNGYFATRGAAAETSSGPSHCPGTYMAGCYNRLVSTVDGRSVENEDLVNLPNWLPLHCRIRPGTGSDAAGEWLSPDSSDLVEHRQELNTWHGELTRFSRYRDPDGRVLDVVQTRLVHMGDPHLAALHTTFTAANWSGSVDIESGLDGDVRNTGVDRYRGLADQHLTGWQTSAGSEDGRVVQLACRTSTSRIGVALAARTNVVSDEAVVCKAKPAPRTVASRMTVPIGPGRPVLVEKTVALHTSRDADAGDVLGAATRRVSAAPDFAALRRSHRAVWRQLWRQAKLRVPGDPGRILNLHLFHLLQTLSPHTAALDAGVPARGLHGEAYRGHVFWDELFVLPYLNLHFPQISRSLLDYRHRRLPQAVRAASQRGRAGAMYPWQSASEGREEAQLLHLNPRSGRWLPDHSRLQHHVGSAVAYNVWRYCQTTGDTAYLHTKGAEMLLNVARFWSDSAQWDDGWKRYSISGVVGPDEYHDAYPAASEPGVKDNTYTNVTAAWVLARAVELCSQLSAPRRQEMFERMDMDDHEPALWADVSRQLRVPFHEGVISQFDGYGDLAELDWEGYRARYGNIRRLDRILEAEGDSVNRYRASKQADVLMLGYLFSPAELRDLFTQLGYELDDELWRATVDHYLPRTSHGSTLSSMVHAWVLTRDRRPQAWRHCRDALIGDVADTQGGTTAEGIHLGAMAGTLDLVQRGLTGLGIDHGVLYLNPAPLPELSECEFTLDYQGHREIDVRMDTDGVRIAVPASGTEPVRLMLQGRACTVAPGETRLIAMRG